MHKYDERDTLFARVNLQKKTQAYKDYYKLHPEYKKGDDEIRRIAFRNNLRKGDDFKRVFFPLTMDNKTIIKKMHEAMLEKEVSSERVRLPKSFAYNIKEIAKYYGATDVGITTLTDYSYYSHHGGVSESLGIDNYGEAIKPSYKTAIVFTVAMDLEMMKRAPHFEELLTTEEAYVKIAYIGTRLAMYLKSLGYRSIANHGEYYLGPMVPLAYDAGLGQIGMANHIVTKNHGNNVRLGAVFTTLEIDTDQPVDFGLVDFCQECALCLMNCPSKSITHKKREVNGRPFYKFNDQSCFNMWVHMGTDCGTCIQSCPFTTGLDLQKVDKMKGDKSLMKELMQEHFDQTGRRAYTKHDLPIVRMEDE